MNGVYCIKDVKAGSFQPGLYVFPTDGLAVRALTSPRALDQLGLVKDYPGDFDLYRLGDFSVDTGALTSDVKFVAHFAEAINHGE